jgi:L-galactose dehydrogenase/L-glyceraldehyde 3-phosphate reductase
MEMRDFGRTGMRVSVFGFGCGAVGGLMVRGSPADQQRAVVRALDAGINYFDTAVQYGNGASETNLGRAWAALKPAAYVGTKIRFTQAERSNIRAAAAASLEGSLHRLGMDHVDIFHLHNAITADGGEESLSVKMVLEEVVPAFEALRQQGKTRFLGITAVGETAALLQVIDSGAFQSAQVSYNMLNPSAGTAVPEKYPAQDYGRLLDHTTAAGLGVIGIRVLAGGALTGTATRHPIASPPPEPIGSALRYEDDLDRARRLAPLVAEGHAVSLAEAATRFVIASPAINTMLVGMATEAEFEQALAAVETGPLSAAALARLAELQRGFVGEAR